MSQSTRRQVMTLTVNGDTHEVLVSPRQTLLDVLRGPLGLTGTKEGCATGTCGVCTINNAQGEAFLSCITPALEWDGKSVTTVEGLEANGELAPVQAVRKIFEGNPSPASFSQPSYQPLADCSGPSVGFQ